MSWPDWWAGWRTRPLHRMLLREAARRYAAHRWPVVPGACLVAGRFDCGDPGCPTTTCHPALADWERAASDNPADVVAWWQRRHHGVLLATGRSFDVLELANPAGRLVAREVRGPVAVAPGDRWMFLVRPGRGLHPALADHASVVLHDAGSWIPAPPTRLATGRVRWVLPPRHCEWVLSNPYDVQRLALQALRFDHQPRRVWRQLNEAA